ncbi:hypothetical protein CSUB01_02201 [Colletotrichum sublineola]|uniref:Uncharacterized protein n=1 Tax=Colletotrichum sublineola TaxID=1173701 RepID=A0A066WZ73_COLSU|nr:hypothetical protein CSUB01_02201 [Colletotrichum sublineola]
MPPNAKVDGNLPVKTAATCYVRMQILAEPEVDVRAREKENRVRCLSNDADGVVCKGGRQFITLWGDPRALRGQRMT